MSATTPLRPTLPSPAAAWDDDTDLAADAERLLTDAAAAVRRLPRLRMTGHAAAAAFDRRLDGPGRDAAARDDARFAALLADAAVLARAIADGIADTAQEATRTRVLMACQQLMPRQDDDELMDPQERTSRQSASPALAPWLGTVAPDRAAQAAAAVARLDALAAALDADGYARTVASVGGAPGHSASLSERLRQLDAVLPQARRAAMVRAAATELAAMRRADADTRRRIERAAHLEQQLWRTVVTQAPAPAPPPRPAEPMLGWMRRLVHPALYEETFEQMHAGWLGVDFFGLRAPVPAPDFLAGIDIRALRPEHVAPFLRRMSLTRRAPRREDLAPEALEPCRGPVATAVRSELLRRWGQPSSPDLPLLPERVRIPRVVHGIWLGAAIPSDSRFLDNYAAAARRYRGTVDFVLWVDITRAACAAARGGPPVVTADAEQLRYVADLLDWAETAGVHLVNVHEVFNAENPMDLAAHYELEMTKQLPRGYTGAGDHLRVELVHTFGGIYADGDLRLQAGRPGFDGPTDLPELLDAVAASRHGFTLNVLPGSGIGNDLIIGPAHHPALQVWKEIARINYCRTQPEIFHGLVAMAGRFVGEAMQVARNITPHRTGRMHHHMLRTLGIDGDDLVLPQAAIATHNELTWVPRPGRPRPVSHPGLDLLARVQRLATFLSWQLVTREGNLYLSAIAPVVDDLPDPDAVWIALLRFLAAQEPLRRLVTSVTDLRRDDDGRVVQVRLPPEAHAMLDRSARPDAWFGSGAAGADGTAWLLDEAVVPVALCRPPG